MNVPHAPGPWERYGGGKRRYGVRDKNGSLCQMTRRDEQAANARLMAAAPDHKMILAAIASGQLRWEKFAHSKDSGELCFNGIRHSTQLDEFGCPMLTDHLRARLAEVHP